MSLCPSQSRVDVSYVFTDAEDQDERTFARLCQRLTRDEQVRAGQYRAWKDKLAFAIGRVLLRKTLSQHFPEPPGGWRFVQNTNGKPALAPSQGTPDIRFNLSHSTGIVVIAFSLGRDVGIDVEFVDQDVDPMHIARSQFSVAEAQMLESLPETRRRQTFFALWTLKEAYIKATGDGLSLPLSQFAFSLDPPTVSFSSQVEDSPNHWSFRQDQLSPLHQIAVAARRRPQETLTYSTKRVNLSDLF
jgi:4'-phosphopantetheinyl transferase